MIPVLLADDPPAQPAPKGGGGPFDPGMFPLYMIAMFVLLYLVVLRPASRRERERQEQMLAGIKRGAKVVTTAGIIGTVVAAKDGENEITIKSEDTRFRILRSAVVQVLGTDEAEAAKA